MKVWQQKMVECARKMSAYPEQGLKTLEELGSKLQEVDDARRLAHTELEALTRRQEHIAQLEKNRESLLKSMAESPGCSGRSDTPTAQQDPSDAARRGNPFLGMLRSILQSPRGLPYCLYC